MHSPTQIWTHARIFRGILRASTSTFQSQEQFFFLGGNETQLAWVLWRGHDNKDADLGLSTGPETGNTIYISMILLCEHFYLGGFTHCHPILIIAHLKLEECCRQPQDSAGGVWMLTATIAMQKVPCFIGCKGGSATHCRSFSFLKQGASIQYRLPLICGPPALASHKLGLQTCAPIPSCTAGAVPSPPPLCLPPSLLCPSLSPLPSSIRFTYLSPHPQIYEGIIDKLKYAYYKTTFFLIGHLKARCLPNTSTRVTHRSSARALALAVHVLTSTIWSDPEIRVKLTPSMFLSVLRGHRLD